MYTVSVCRRASGKGWRAVARYKDEDGWHNTTKSLRDARNKAEAIRMARDWEIELNGSSAATGPVVAYVADYIDRKAAGRWCASTCRAKEKSPPPTWGEGLHQSWPWLPLRATDAPWEDRREDDVGRSLPGRDA